MNKVKLGILSIMVLTVTVTIVMLMVAVRDEQSVSGNEANSSASVDVIDMDSLIADDSVSDDNAADSVSDDAVKPVESDPVEHDGMLSFIGEDGHAFFTIEKNDFEYNYEYGFYHSMRSADYFEISYLTNMDVAGVMDVYEKEVSLEDYRDMGIENPGLYYEVYVGEINTPYGLVKIFKSCVLNDKNNNADDVEYANISYWGILPVDDKIVRFSDYNAFFEYNKESGLNEDYYDILGEEIEFDNYEALTEAFDSDEKMYDAFVEHIVKAFE